MTRAPETVFLVDDEPNVLKALSRLLIDEPYEVATFTDPAAALKAVTEKRPNLIVADYYMPVMRGPELLARVRRIDSGIIRMVLTGKPDVSAVLSAVNEGEVYRFILKPWDDDELKLILRNALDYARLTGERDRLLVELDRQRKTLEALERNHPGISKLPNCDTSGAFVLTEADLPKKS